MIQAEENYYELPENVTTDIAKAVQTQIWKDYLFVLFFALTASVVTFGVK